MSDITAGLNVFSEIHSDIPREGPGNNESTRKALSFLSRLPKNAAILDIGCGPGMQTIELAKTCDARITALDTKQTYLDEVDRRAVDGGFSEQITTIRASMRDLPFDLASFDAIWAEGAIYIIGFEEGLGYWKSFLKPGGYVAVTEICWLKNGVPEEPLSFWAEAYPDMTTIDRRLETIRNCGYTNVAHFTIPESGWWDDFYGPLENRIDLLKAKYADTTDAMNALADAQREIDIYRKYSEFYGYVFFIMELR